MVRSACLIQKYIGEPALPNISPSPPHLAKSPHRHTPTRTQAQVHGGHTYGFGIDFTVHVLLFSSSSLELPMVLGYLLSFGLIDHVVQSNTIQPYPTQSGPIRRTPFSSSPSSHSTIPAQTQNALFWIWPCSDPVILLLIFTPCLQLCPRIEVLPHS